MKKLPPFFIAGLVAVLATTGTNGSESNAKADPLPSPPSTTTPPSAGKETPPALTEGMTGVEIRKIIGNPAEVKPFDSPDGKAETWTYRRVLEKQTVQETVSVPNTARNNGQPDAGGTTMKVQSRAKHTTTYQVTTLLLYDGKLVKARQSVTKTVSYDE